MRNTVIDAACWRDGVRLAVTCLGLAGLLPGTPARAADGAQVASDHGCLNCHSGQSHSAPSLTRLAEKFGRSGTGPEALSHMLGEMREQSSIHTHQRVSDDSARAILKWMAEGAK